MTQTQPIVRATLSASFAGCDGWIPLAEIMAHETCEGWILIYEWSRKNVRYKPGMWAAFLTDLRDNGLRHPVMWDSDRSELGNGHHRVVAAYDLGWTHVPYVDWDGDLWTGGSWEASGGDD